jgi:hypothetical protein
MGKVILKLHFYNALKVRLINFRPILRLPKSLVPEKYRIFLTPFIGDGNDTIHGTVYIEFEGTEMFLCSNHIDNFQYKFIVFYKIFIFIYYLLYFYNLLNY